VHPDVPVLIGPPSGYVVVYFYDPETRVEIDHERLRRFYSLSEPKHATACLFRGAAEGRGAGFARTWQLESAGNRQCWSVATFGQDIAAAGKALAAERVILIGHSMGGAVALEAARRLGEMVAAVVLVDTFVIDYGGLSGETIQAIAAPFETDFASAMAALVEQTATAATPAVLKEKLIREMSAADPVWALPVWRDLLAWDPGPAFEELRVPIHAVNGALIPDSARERCAPFVRETVIPGAGHFLQMEDPAGFNRVLAGVLAQF
jgi:pimeloyl-ACP methyl ester carboxylesterase